MPDQRKARWAQEFETAALEILARRTDLPDRDFYRCRTESCTRHGYKCLAVICGEVLEHVAWKNATPSGFAEEFLNRNLPQKPAE